MVRSQGSLGPCDSLVRQPARRSAVPTPTLSSSRYHRGVIRLVAAVSCSVLAGSLAAQPYEAFLDKASAAPGETVQVYVSSPETYEVRANGELLVCEPAEVLPMAQRYFLF